MPRYDALPASLPPRGLAREAAAQYIGIGSTKFDTMVADGRMPRPLRIDGRAVWDIRALDRSFDSLDPDQTPPQSPKEVISDVICGYKIHVFAQKDGRHLDNTLDKTISISRGCSTEEEQVRRSKWKYVHSFVDRHGKVRNYFRRRGFSVITLPEDQDSLEFLDAYRAALSGEPTPQRAVKVPISNHSVDAVVGRFLVSQQFKALSPFTQKNVRPILQRFRREHAADDFPALQRADYKKIIATRETAWIKRSLLRALRIMIKWVIDVERLLEEDPTLGIKCPAPKTDGFYTWMDEDIAAFRKKYPSGTRERLALELFLHTAQRRTDIVQFGPKNIRGGKLHLIQHKTKTPLVLPLHPDLLTELAFVPDDQPTFLVTVTGRPFTSSKFTDWFRQVCNVVDDLPKEASAHGLRKAACRRLAEAGCTAKEIQSISGHLTLSEVQRYIDKADKEKMANVAQEKIISKFSVQ